MEERDACGLVAIARKDGRSDTRVLVDVIDGLRALAHRSGCVDGEGDGAGVLTDIPRILWAERLEAEGRDPRHARSDRFAVAHLFVPHTADDDEEAAVRRILARHKVTILIERAGATTSEALGPRDLDLIVAFAEFLKARRAARGFAHHHEHMLQERVAPSGAATQSKKEDEAPS